MGGRVRHRIGAVFCKTGARLCAGEPVRDDGPIGNLHFACPATTVRQIQAIRSRARRSDRNDVLGPVNTTGADGVASENRARPGGGRGLWRVHRLGRQRSMARFSPQPEGTGSIFPISASVVASRHPVCVAPHSLNSEKLAPVAIVPVVLTGPSSRSESGSTPCRVLCMT